MLQNSSANLACRCLLILVVMTLALSSDTFGQNADADAKKVMALMRLKQIDVNTRPKLKTIVLRHMDQIEDTTQWLTLADRFLVPESASRAIEIATQSESDANAVAALKLLIQLNLYSKITVPIEATKAPLAPEKADESGNPTDALKPQDEMAADIRRAERLASRLRLIDNQELGDWIWQQMADVDRYPNSVANQLAKAAVEQNEGAAKLLEMAKSDTLPASIRLAVASSLSRHPDPEIQKQAAEVLPLPQSKNVALPPIEELTLRRGDIANGRAVFAGVGTCAKCHVVNNIGSSIGPDLSEIGSKLARDAMYTSILDPSAAISHNYENYAVQTVEGKIYTGLLMSETDDKVILKSADGVPTEILRDDIEAMKKLNMSLMPADLVRSISEQELIDLVEYLTTLKKAGQ